MNKKIKDIPDIKRVESKNEIVRQYARVVLLAMKLREESFDHKKAETASEYADFETFYKLDKFQAIETACKKEKLPIELAYPIYISFEWWNDIHDWAQEQLGE